MRKSKRSEELKDLDIFVMISQTSNDFYVWKTPKGFCYNTYKQHVGGKRKETKAMFEQAEKDGKYPKMYVLETVNATQKIAFRHCLAWTRYFLDHGMNSVSYDTTVRQAMDLLEETQVIYDGIKQDDIDLVLSDDRAVVRNYTRKEKATERTPKREIKVTVTPEQYEEILKKSQKERLSMSRYCKHMILNGRIIIFEMPPLHEFMAEVRGATRVLRQILAAIYYNKRYYPADLENIQKMGDKIIDCHRGVTDSVQECAKEIMKLKPK